MAGANVYIHESQFPERVRADLIASLRARRINHKFHYDSYKQAQKWLALHEAYSPARKDADCERIYEAAFRSAIDRLGTQVHVHVIGLGCGGGQKEAALLKLAKQRGTELVYTPSDVSLGLVLTARNAVSDVVAENKCQPVVCDLASVSDLSEVFGDATMPRVITFFGMIPNFEPEEILPKLRSLLRKDDVLLFSANLAPGENYAEGVRTILPQYDNALTKEWLLTLLLDLGVERNDGEVRFSIESTPLGYLRVAADYVFANAREIQLENERFSFGIGETVRLFFSYRYQPSHIVELLRQQSVVVLDQFVARSGEEGVFVCRLAEERSGAAA